MESILCFSSKGQALREFLLFAFPYVMIWGNQEAHIMSNENEQGQEYTDSDPIRRNQGLETASMILGLFALFSVMIIYVSIPLAALSIITGLLSRGNGRVKGRSKRGIMIGGIALGASLGITAVTVGMYFTNPQYRQTVHELVDYYMERYGLESTSDSDTGSDEGTLGGILQQMSEKADDINEAQGSIPAPAPSGTGNEEGGIFT